MSLKTLSGKLEGTFDHAWTKKIKGNSEFRGDTDPVLLAPREAQGSRKTHRKGKLDLLGEQSCFSNMRRRDYEGIHPL